MIAEAPPASSLSDRLIQRRPLEAPVATTSVARPWLEPSSTDSSLRAAIANELANRRLAPLADLQMGWDTHGGRAPTRAALVAAQALLASMLLDGLPQPGLVPVADGGITLEWTGAGYEFAVSISESGDPADITVYYFREATGAEWEIALPDADDRVTDAFIELRATVG